MVRNVTAGVGADAAAGASLLDLSAAELVRVLAGRHPGRIVCVSSFGTETAVLLHMVAAADPAMPVLFLDTGQHFPETRAYRRALARQLGLTAVRDVAPDAAELAGRDPFGALWASDPDGCCGLRKVRPLALALAGYDVWLNGRKRHHGGARGTLPVIERDGPRLKVSPLAAWSAAEIQDYARLHDLPAHPMVADGYASVGCRPCTARAGAGEAVRAGRWRGTGKTECGIHTRLSAEQPSATP